MTINKFLYFTLCFLLPALCFCQIRSNNFNFGIQIGAGWHAVDCNNTIDSVKVLSQTSGGLYYGYVNLFAEKKINSSFRVRAEASYHFSTISGYLVYHLQKDSFGDYFDQSVAVSSPAIHLPIYAVFHLPQPFNRLGVLAGIDNQFQFKKLYHFDHSQRGLRPEAADVMDHLENTTKSYVPYYILGAKMDIGKRLVVIIKKEKNFNKSYTRRLEHYGRLYEFNTKRAYLFITIGYKFYSLKIKKKKNRDIAVPR